MSLVNLDGRTIEREVSRFDLAYRSIMQHATLALHACGYRTPTSKPGHHMTLIQTLPLSIGLDPASTLLLDSLRKQRNGIDYSGDMVSKVMADACLAEAQALSARVRRWLAETHPELL